MTERLAERVLDMPIIRQQASHAYPVDALQLKAAMRIYAAVATAGRAGIRRQDLYGIARITHEDAGRYMDVALTFLSDLKLVVRDIRTVNGRTAERVYSEDEPLRDTLKRSKAAKKGRT